MGLYVAGMVIPVKRSKLAKYRTMARRGGKVWIKHGALEYRECIADDVKPGKHTSFPQSVKLKKGEVVFFSYITFSSRKAHDRAFMKVMADPGLTADFKDPKSWPFDGKRMFWGGFDSFVALKGKAKRRR